MTACVATIGNFDGVHLGHQQIIAALLKKATALQLPSCVILFEPQPKEFFLKEKAPPRLNRLREKVERLKELGIERVVCLRFHQRFATMPAEQFIHTVLIEQFQVHYLLVGDDFRFGYQRQGDFSLLKQCQLIDVVATPSCVVDGQRVSSSLIREVLQQGNFTQAKAYLGDHYAISGRVIHGDKRGRELGYPTANIALHRRKSVLKGVYVVTIRGLDHQLYHGVASLGHRPTVGGGDQLLEVYIFDFDQRIYGQTLRIAFLHKLRDQAYFASLDLLMQQMAHDVTAGKAYFNC